MLIIGAILDSLKGELDLIFKIEISLFVIKVCIGNNLFGNKKIPRRNANASGGGEGSTLRLSYRIGNMRLLIRWQASKNRPYPQWLS